MTVTSLRRPPKQQLIRSTERKLVQTDRQGRHKLESECHDEFFPLDDPGFRLHDRAVVMYAHSCRVCTGAYATSTCADDNVEASARRTCDRPSADPGARVAMNSTDQFS